jgi:hypothetical protein
MCNFLSGVVTRDERLLFGNLQNHAGIETGWGLAPGEYREFEWTEDDPSTLTVRTEVGEDNAWWKSIIVAKHATRESLLASIVEGRTDGTKWYYRNGVLHRDGNLPAIECADGTKWYYRNGEVKV